MGVGVGDCVGTGVDVGVGIAVCVGVGEGDAVAVETEGVGDDSGEVSFCGESIGLGVGDAVAFVGVAVTVGDLRSVEADGFFFGVAVGVGFGVGVCALRSTPRLVPRPTATRVLSGVGEGFS